MGGLKPSYCSLKSDEFREVYYNGKKYVGKFFVVFLLEEMTSLKIGFVASKRVGKAYQRNRAKRLLREIVRINQNRLPRSIYLVFVARRNILSGSFADIESSFLNFVETFLNNNENEMA